MAPLNTLQAAQLVSGLSGLSLGFSGGTNVLAQNLQRQSAATIQQELIRKARKEQEKKKKGALGGKIGSALGLAAGAALAPFTGGLSLAAAGALSGGLAGAGGLIGKSAAGGDISGRDVLQAGLSTGLGAASGALGGIGQAQPTSLRQPSFGGPFSPQGGQITAAPLGVGGPTSAIPPGGTLTTSAFQRGPAPAPQDAFQRGPAPPPQAAFGGGFGGGTLGGIPGGTLEAAANPAVTRGQQSLSALGDFIDLQQGPGGTFTSNLGGPGIGPSGPLGTLFADDANAPLRLSGPVVGLDPQQRAQVAQELERENVRVEEARVQERQDLTAQQERQKDRALRISVAQADIKARKDIELLRKEGIDVRALEGREATQERFEQTQANLFERQQIGIDAAQEAAALRVRDEKPPAPTVAQKRILDEIDETTNAINRIGLQSMDISATSPEVQAQQLRSLRSRQNELRNLLIQSGGEAFLMAPEDGQEAGALSLRLDPATGNIIFNPPDGSAGIPVRQRLTPLIR